MEIHDFDDTIKWYDRNAEEYAKNHSALVPLDSIEKFLKYLPPNPRILDAGCGPGREEKVFQRKGAVVTGVDVSDGLLRIARQNNPRVEFVKANFLELPFDSNMFDGVWAHASLVHLDSLDDAKKALSEFYRALKPAGIVYVCVKAQVGTEKTAVVSDSLSKHDRFFRYYDAEELSGLLEGAGFEMISTCFQEDMRGRETRWLECIARKPRKS